MQHTLDDRIAQLEESQEICRSNTTRILETQTEMFREMRKMSDKLTKMSDKMTAMSHKMTAMSHKMAEVDGRVTEMGDVVETGLARHEGFLQEILRRLTPAPTTA